MKKYRHYQNRISGVIIFLIFFLGISVVIYSDSREQTLEEQRKVSYGAWHAAVYHVGEKENTLKENAMVKTAATLTLAGTAADNSGMILGGIGAADATFLSMGNITLLDGRMPEKENEIAIEASRLIDMGLSYELGQQIPLSVQTADDPSSVIQQNFTLTGVVKNYTNYWKTNGNTLVSFFITPEKCRQITCDRPGDIHLFLVFKSAFAKNADSLKPLCSGKNSFVKNDFVYLMYSDKESNANNPALPLIVLLLTGCTAITFLIISDLTKQRDTFVIMRVLGAEKTQILKLYILRNLPVLAVSAIAGVFSGIVFPLFLFWFLEKQEQSQICFTFSVPHVLGVIFIFIIGIFCSAAFGFIRLFQIPLRGKSAQQAAVKNIPRHRKSLNEKNLFSVLDSLQRKKQLLSIFFIFTSASFVLLSFYYTWEKYQDYKEYCTNYPDDYSFGTMLTYYLPRDVMSEETLQELPYIYGVSDIKTVAVSDYSAITFSGSADRQYLSFVREKMSDITGDAYSRFTTEVGGVLTGISDNLLPVYLRQADLVSDSVSKNGLENDEVLLYLPDYLETGSDFAEYNGTRIQSGGTLYEERKIQPGDHITFSGASGTVRLRIAGIIHQLPKSFPASLNPLKPFSLLCSKDTYTGIQGNYEPCYLLIQADNSAVAYQTDVELSKLNTDLYFNNFRLEKETNLQSLTLQWVLALILCISGFLVTTLIRLGICISARQAEESRYKTLWQLGMDRQSITRYLLLSGFRENVIGITLSLLALFLVRCVKEWFVLTNIVEDSSGGTLLLMKESLQNAVLYTDWGTVLFINLILLAVHFSVTTVCNSGLIQQKRRKNIRLF